MAARANRQRQLVLPGEVDAMHHIGHVDAAGHPARAAIDHAVVDPAGLIVTGVAAADQWTAQGRRQPVRIHSVHIPEFLSCSEP